MIWYQKLFRYILWLDKVQLVYHSMLHLKLNVLTKNTKNGYIKNTYQNINQFQTYHIFTLSLTENILNLCQTATIIHSCILINLICKKFEFSSALLQWFVEVHIGTSKTTLHYLICLSTFNTKYDKNNTILTSSFNHIRYSC